MKVLHSSGTSHYETRHLVLAEWGAMRAEGRNGSMQEKWKELDTAKKLTLQGGRETKKAKRKSHGWRRGVKQSHENTQMKGKSSSWEEGNRIAATRSYRFRGAKKEVAEVGVILLKPSHMADSVLWYVCNLYEKQFYWLGWVYARACSPGGRGTWYWCRGSWKAWRSRSPFHALLWWSGPRPPGQLSERQAEPHHMSTKHTEHGFRRITSHLWHSHLKRRWEWHKKISIGCPNPSNALLYPSASLSSNSTICGKDNPALALCSCLLGSRELTKGVLSRQITWQSKGW